MSKPHTENVNSSDNEYSGRRVELSLVLEFTGKRYLNADGGVNEDLMRREALDYAAEAARNGEVDIEITLTDEVSK